MSARGWADRLSGGPSDPGSKPPEGGRGQGSGSPYPSDSPDPSRPDGGGVRPRPPVHEPRGSALRVVLVSRDSMLAIALPSLIEAPGVVRTLDWYSDELDSAIRHADVVVIDMPPALYERTFAVIDGRFLGRTVVLLQEGEHPEALPPGPPRAVLYRPLQIAELWAAVSGVWPAVPSAEEAEGSEGTDRGPGEEGPGPEAGADTDPPEPEAGAAPAAAMPGLPVAESGLLIGLSGRELEPVIGPGQVAPGMDEDTLERLRRWRTLGRQPASGTSGAGGAAGTRAGRSDRARQASAEARRERAAKAEARAAARKQARQARQAQRQAAQEASRQASEARAAEKAAARQRARLAKAAEAEARKASEAAARRVKEAEAEARRTAEEAAGRAKAEQAAKEAAAREEARRVKAAQDAERAAAREAARAQAGQERAAQAEARKAARDEARRVRADRVAARKVARAEKAGTRVAAERAWVAGGLQLLLVVVVLVAVAMGAAGWRSGGGPDTQAGEVAVVRAAGGTGGGLVAQDPRVGPISPVYALAAGTWLRVNEAKASLEGTVREARVPGRLLLAVVVALTVVLFLLLMRVGPGTGAAAGPGPAPPQRWEEARRIGGAALAGVLVALDPLLVRNGRAATGTILALVLALGALALAWAVPARPALRWLPLVAALGGLALLVSPLALPVLLVPVAVELLGGRYREAWPSLAALALAIGVWLLLPVWVAGQGLGPGQAGWLLGRPSGRGSLAASMGDAPLSWLLLAAGLAAAILAWRHRSGARPGDGAGDDRPLAWVATTAAGALVAAALGYPAGQALAFAIPAAAVALALAAGRLAVPEAGTRGNTGKLAGGVRGTAGVVPRWISAGIAVALAGLVVAQGVDWTSRYSRPADDGLGRLVATVAAQVPRCSAVNASGPDDRARLLAAGVTVTEFSDGPAATAAGVRYFVLTGATTSGGPLTPSLAAWVREHGDRLAAQPSRSLSGIELWRVDPAPLDPVADSLPVPGGMFSNVTGSACGGYRVTDSQLGAFYSAYRAVGGKAVLGRPLGSVWTSDGPALQAFDTMVLGAVPAASGPPAVKPIELPPLLAKLDVEAVAGADIPLPSGRPPVTDRQALALLDDELIARAYLGTDPAAATPEDWRRARERFGRPLGTPQTMPDGAVRQPFERAVLELPADGGPARPAALGRLAVRLGLVPKQAMRLEPVPGLPAGPAETRLDTGPLLRPLGLVLGLLALAAAAGTVLTWRSRADRPKEAVADR